MGKPTILLMDNDAMARMALTTLLTKALPDCTMLPAVSQGADAIRLCTGTAHPPTVLLADVSMNDINGPLVVRAIRKTNDTTAVLALTASVLANHARDMADAGAQGIASKNDDIRLLAVAIHALLQGHTWGDTADVRFDTMQEAHRRVKAEGTRELSPREIEVVNMWSHGESLASIAAALGISEPTVRTQLKRACDKLGVADNRALIAAWVKLSTH
ncbi:response regulator transcription factor [Bifidobacterium oedipodis]|uniref:DNA-binding response regulator n=1 Tax=Bifidobacterium oedipodis TaxID=2675322 RepID=A0A7Y0ERP6_9BIFI|nr:response regulator transcription factor [Bifidobacterium sp. DSM 109957]NMM94738.1 DNA-binding response regulator [Bifidobacterium sp. DSM 109957]